MKSFYRLTAVIVLALLFCGCVRPVQIIHGEEVEVLTAKEEQQLISLARDTFLGTRHLDKEEKEAIRTTEPELSINYIADRTGDARITWKLSKRSITLLMRGTFLTTNVQWVMQVEDRHNEYLDLRKKK